MASIKGISLRNYFYKQIGSTIQYSCLIYLEKMFIGSFVYSSNSLFNQVQIYRNFQNDFNSRVSSYFADKPAYFETNQHFIEDLISLHQLETIYNKHLNYNQSLYLLELNTLKRTSSIYDVNCNLNISNIIICFSKDQVETLVDILEPEEYFVYSSPEDFYIY